MLPLKLEDPVGVAPLSAFSVATPAPDKRTVPTGGTAGASVRSVSRSRPWAVAAEANAKRRVAGRRMAERRVPPPWDSPPESGRGPRIGVAGWGGRTARATPLGRAPFGDFVLGPDHVEKVPQLVESGGVETNFVDTEHSLFPRAARETSGGRATACVTAMKGCD